MTCPIRKDSKRRLIKDYLRRIERDIPRVRHSIFASLGNVDPRSLCVRGKIHEDFD